MSVCEECMKGKEKGDGVADEESNSGVTDEESKGGVTDEESKGRVADKESSGENAIEALHQSVTPFVPAHRSDARADGRVDWCAIERCMKGKERGVGVTEEGSHDGNEIEALHESATPFAPVHRSDARADGVGVRPAVDAEEGERRRSRRGRR
ncbi:hypothetical protein Scep_019619 [Stephania cephalantha]|uniref:Uncharacterized protein n=1 Tax=Stephania cephalantha TaxID=152367 RepID=A0AAP0IB85_9MAGN